MMRIGTLTFIYIIRLLQLSLQNYGLIMSERKPVNFQITLSEFF
ncbi:hypothetical protein SARI_01083 [Salmonella enterica subsp. arizonae serovar 62:z4,z23:-]|uniref:Uncharacterized protein n=1 Tax=Salmonella arizonae (strain ATCC BAA-731 / CDC346-86 / RSK2980) TaxID=41514 RepID=A9MNG7_SALAR|nr:hypothetical protein SARI_01083 [Salmonella enterica subsp. arizonae serovar 62:z4,z23:-]